MLENRKKKGFTLIELIVVIAILGILAAVLIPKFAGFTDKAKGTQATVNAKQIGTAIESLEAEDKVYSESAITGQVVFNVADIQKIAQIDGVLTAVTGTPASNGDIKITAKSGTQKCSGFVYIYKPTGGKTYTVTRSAETGAFSVGIGTN